jgi:hypothetical protein
MDRLRNLELARKLLEEAKGYIGKGDPVQASEKLYKVAEEALKFLSTRYAVDISEEASRRGRWTTNLLFKAVETMAEKLGEDLRRCWNTAWTLHVEGFHEANLDAAYVARNIGDIQELLRLAEKEES